MDARGLHIDRSRASPNHGARIGRDRPDCIVLHYTGMRDGPSAIDWLCNPASQVSCHYVVTEAGAVLQLVDEERRAWHAGRSLWRGETDINSASLGIEIVNGGHDFDLPPFPEAQVAAVILLCRDIMNRHAIQPERILAHSDIAPSRKRDPGERFPWRTLAGEGIGYWPEPSGPEADHGTPVLADVQARFARLGYGLSVTGLPDHETAAVVRAFQRRYLPDRIDGVADAQILDRLDALLRLHGIGT